MKTLLLLAAIGLACVPGRPAAAETIFAPSSDLAEAVATTFDELLASDRPSAFYRLCRAALDADDPGLVRHADGRFLAVALYARCRIAALRGAELERWREFAEPEARGCEGVRGARPPVHDLRRLVDRFPNTGVAARAAKRLADALVERGDLAGALEIVETALDWALAEDLAGALSRRGGFLRGRLGLLAAGGIETSPAADARASRRLTASFARPLARLRWREAEAGRAEPVWTVFGESMVLRMRPNRIRAVLLDARGLPDRACPPLFTAASVAHALALRHRILLTTRAEASPWILPSGRRDVPSNRIIAVDAPANRGAWELPSDRFRSGRWRVAVFVSPCVDLGDDVGVVLTRVARGGTETSSLLRIDPETGAVRGERTLFTRLPGRDAPGLAPRASWEAAASGSRLFLSDGRSVLVLLEAGCVRWIHPHGAVEPLFRTGPPWRRSLLCRPARVFAAPPDALRLYAFRAVDGALLASRALAPAVRLFDGGGGRVWVQGEREVGWFLAGDPDLALRARRELPSGAGAGFVFGTVLAVPCEGRLALFGSSDAFRKTLVVPGPRVDFSRRGDALMRVGSDAATVFRVPEDRAAEMLGILPYVSDADAAAAIRLFLPWLGSSDARLRRWAWDLLQDRAGVAPGFDPDAGEAERKRALRDLERRLGVSRGEEGG